MTNLIQTMKSMLMMKSRHSNTRRHHTTTGFARRALLLFTFFVACMGSVWGQEFTKKGTPAEYAEEDLVITDGLFKISATYLNSFFGEYLKYVRFTAYNSLDEAIPITNVESDYREYKSFGSLGYVYWGGNQAIFWNNDGEITITLAEGTTKLECYILNAFQNIWESEFQEDDDGILITYEMPSLDTFEDPDKSPKSTGTDITKYLTNETKLPLDITKATALLDGAPKYARFYVLHNGEPLDLSKNADLLKIENVTPVAQLPKKGIYGYYLYNSGNELNLSGITITLNAEAGKFPEYQVICVLSTQEARVATGNDVTEEPYWDVVFTYAFRNQVETKNQTGTVEWDAVAMTATIPTDDMAEKWGTSWSNLAQEQKIQWYVTDGIDVKQPLVFGTERQADTWTINLSEPFVVKDDVAVLTGQTTYDATSFEVMWNIWGNPTVYAPANKSYADVKDYKIVCEIADDPESTKPNVIYTLSINKTQFAGQEKATIVKTAQQVKLDANATLANISFHLPEGTKYVRFYIVDQNGDVKNNEFGVNESWQECENTDAPGWYAYSESGLSLSGSITINRNSANLNDYQVIMVTSTETAVMDENKNTVGKEPDYDTQTTFWFKYPVDTWEVEDNVDWSPQSMQIIAPNIDMQGDVEGEKGAGYLEKNRQHYTLEWTVVDKDGNAQQLCIGSNRVDNCWSFNIVANPFTLADDGKSLVASNDPNLNVITWNSWAGPQIFAPKNMTMKQIAAAGIKFVCKLYEDDEAGDPNMVAMTYTINIVRKEELGQLKDDGIYYEKIIEDITHDQEIFHFDSSEPLQNAITAFQKEIGKPATYVRIYLTRNDGAPLHPGDTEDENEQLIIENATLFENNPKYGYYFHNENGVDLSDITATLKLPDGWFTYYNVMVAMSGDTDEIDFTADKFNEPDYDYIYAFKFVETSSFPSTTPVESLITHTKDVQIKAGDNNNLVLIPLHDDATINEFLSELGETSNFDDVAKQYFHVRWFVAKKNTDGTYEKLAGSENMLDAVSTDYAGTTITGTRTDLSHVKRRNQGIYWNHDYVSQYYSNYSKDILKVSFTKPTDGNWSDYQVVVWMTNSNDGAIIGTDGALSHEPDIKIQYIYSFVEEEIAPDLPFVHYQGEAYRYLKEKGEDVAAQQRDYMTLDGDAWLQEYTWNIASSSYEPISGNIRQSVHTWEYDIYVVPGETRPLMLPFQLYDSVNQWGGPDDSGNEDEPRAYIRWYDWKTDTKVIGNNFVFDKTENSQLSENDRGLFGLCVPDNPIHKRVGVTFTPNADFTETFDVACDVSKYSDGIVNVNGKYHLLHEPTLSSRYIFHIHPASEIADSLEKARQRYEAAESTGDAKTLYDAMSTLKEDKGKVVVSITDEKTEFSLRFDLQYLSDYIIYDGDMLIPAEKVKWLVYFENANGLNTRELNTPTSLQDYGNFDCQIDASKRIYTFSYETFKNLGSGKRFHIVGFVRSGTYEAPVVHYELEFMEAPPVPLSKILSNATDDKIKYKERMESYMSLHYEAKGVVDFDGNPETNENIKKNPYEALYYYSTPNWDSEPTSSLDNISYVPFPWDDIQYGFCYPQLTSTIRNGYIQEGPFVTPEHSDYTILKTMKVDKISNGDEYHLWAGVTGPFYDYTYHATVNNKERPTQYGSFLYTDASDESRSIATIPFTAELCSGSSFYFTAVVANLTDKRDQVPPQLLIRIVGIKDDGTRERIVAFHTAKLDYTKAEVDLGQWYQIYCASTLSKDFDTSITQFEAEVINYANGTLGADFALDQIVIYTSNTKVLLTQTGDASCKPNEDDVEPDKVKAYMEADGLQNAFGISDELQPIYWRICDEETGEVITGLGMYPRYDKEGNLTTDDGTFTYGITWVKSNYTDNDLNQITEDHPYGWYYEKESDKYFFQIADKSFDALEEGKHYYVSVFDPTADFNDINDDSLWGGLYFGAKSRCSIYSEFFVPRRQYVTYTYGKNGTEGGELTITCGGTGAAVSDVQMILKVPDSNEPTGYKNYTNFHYDFAYVSLKTWKSADATFEYEGATYKYAVLNEALIDYRANTTYGDKYNSKIGLDSNYESDNPTYYNLLDCAIKAGILELACSPTFNHEFTSVGNYTVTCIPIEKYIYPDNSDPVEICAPFEVTFKLRSSGGPELDLGFSDVTYPTTPTKYLRVVRVGLKQIKAMQQSDGYLLHIPVHSFKTNNDAVSNDGVLQIEGDMELLASSTGDDQTNDADWNANVAVAGFASREISKSKMYVSVNFHDKGITQPKQTFKEGFTYRMFFRVKDENAGDGACDAGVEFLIKVVPEYVTWNDKGTTVTPNSNKTNNWNNDENWSRSKADELYSGTYVDNTGETPASFVPMKFTYVTIPSDNVAPNLIGLTRGTDDGIYYNIGEGATSNIQYDLMVMVDEENECTHGGGADAYDCEKFYGNWAKEIYFKPRAELVHQQYLTYGKAWVEKELVANKWYLMSTPLKETYAGDMYVPYESGRQETEAFEAINFSDQVDDKNIYSRTKYPIYQRSWLQEGARVYTTQKDVRATDYSAALKGSITEKLSLWSHVYNDVTEDYSQWTGFAVRAHKQEQKDEQNNDIPALIRLPKEDTDYDYYKWDGEVPEADDGKVTQAVEKSKTGRLLTDDAADGIVKIPVGKVQEANGYLLVGNPYLCSIKMDEFLKENYNDGNGILETEGYWTYEDNTVNSPKKDDFIRPLQAFFVKVKGDITDGNQVIKFTRAMMMDGNNPPAAPSRAFTLTAANDRGRSTANVSVGEEAKSVETLFDSNLAEVPMVYTVADGQAMSVNQVTETGRPIAFGVTCDSSEPVAVTFSDIELLTTGELYVVDAVTGEQTAVDEGSTLSIQPNDYGRYFLLTRALGSDEQVDVQKGIVISVRGREVTVTSDEALALVRVLSPDGTTVHQEAGGGTTASFVLTSGVYIVKADNAAGEQQAVKIVVK